MISFQSKTTDRRKTYLRLAGEIESQLRDAYDRKHRIEGVTQSSLAQKLGINRSAIHHRLMGQTNMTVETIADMIWALGCKINVTISDAQNATSNDVVTTYVPSLNQVKSTTTVGTVSIGGTRKTVLPTQPIAIGETT